MQRSHRWEARSLKRHLEDVRKQAMYAVIHGGLDIKMRTQSVEYLTSLPFVSTVTWCRHLADSEFLCPEFIIVTFF